MPLVGLTFDSGFAIARPSSRITDLARAVLDSTWASEWSETVRTVTPAPPDSSPPMSGTPHTLREATSEASDLNSIPRNYSAAAPQDAYVGYSTQSPPNDSQPSHSYPGPSDPYSRSYPSDGFERMNYGYHHPSDRSNRPPSFASEGQGLPSISPGGPHTLPFPQASASPQLMESRPSTVESQPGASPKSQRKAKGHVASACVPCKKAHLRCDSQRPCSRCISNGKEDSCHDVVHKKRGRPRLRDDREARYDLSRPPPPHDAGYRRSFSAYPPPNASVPLYDSAIHHHQHVRELHPHPSEQPGHRYMQRGYYADEYAYGRPMSNPRPPEPVAYLTIDLEYSHVSDTFNDAIGGLGPRRTLVETVAFGEREKVRSLHRELSVEQKRREPNYLPPILGRIDHALQRLSFAAEDVAKFRLAHQEYLTFVAVDGQTRVYPVQLGLAKEGSYYFVVAVLGLNTRPQHPPAVPQTTHKAPLDYSAHTAGPPPSYSQQQRQPLLAHDRPPQHSPPTRHLPHALHPIPLHNRGMNPSSGPLYPSISNMHEYPRPPQNPPPQSQHHAVPQSHPQTYQLPPIRAPLEHAGNSRDSSWQQREERTNRVDIGGLIEKPEGPGQLR